MLQPEGSFRGLCHVDQGVHSSQCNNLLANDNGLFSELFDSGPSYQKWLSKNQPKDYARDRGGNLSISGIWSLLTCVDSRKVQSEVRIRVFSI